MTNESMNQWALPFCSLAADWARDRQPQGQTSGLGLSVDVSGVGGHTAVGHGGYVSYSIRS